VARFVAERDPTVRAAATLERRHVEAYKTWLAERPAQRRDHLHRHTIGARLGVLRSFFERIIEWGWEDVPGRVPLVAGDFPIPDKALPRFLDDAAAAKLLVAARADPDPFVRLTVEFLARTGLRKGEYLHLTVDAVVQIGSAYWLRVPVGKLHTDRYIPLHPQLKALLDDWLATRPPELRSNLVFVDHGRAIPEARVDQAVATAARAAGIGHVSPHQLRHTLATQAINRGMSLEAIATLLGHRSMRMTLTYARISDRTVADEYFRVTEAVEAGYRNTEPVAAQVEGPNMRRLAANHRRLLGNGHCTRPAALDCTFESICERCGFFETGPQFVPILRKQRDHAADNDQHNRAQLFTQLLDTIDDNS
jgi:integrase